MKLITKDTDYVIQALVFMAENSDSGFSVKEISEELGISLSYLRKLLQILNKKGVLSSMKGKGGGFTLKLKPEKIFVSDLINIFQGKLDIKNCYVKNKRCSNLVNCILHKKLINIEDFIKKEIGTLSIKDIIEAGKKLKRSVKTD